MNLSTTVFYWHGWTPRRESFLFCLAGFVLTDKSLRKPYTLLSKPKKQGNPLLATCGAGGFGKGIYVSISSQRKKKYNCQTLKKILYWANLAQANAANKSLFEMKQLLSALTCTYGAEDRSVLVERSRLEVCCSISITKPRGIHVQKKHTITKTIISTLVSVY